MAFKNIFSGFMKGKKEPQKDESIRLAEDAPPVKKHRTDGEIARLMHAFSVTDTLKSIWKKGDIRTTYFGQIFYSKGRKASAVKILLIIESMFPIYFTMFFDWTPSQAEGAGAGKFSLFGKQKLRANLSASKEQKRSALGIIMSPLYTQTARVIETSLHSNYTLRDLFEIMLKEGASDLHISIGLSPKFRIKGELADTALPPITSEKAWDLVRNILSDKQLEIFDKEWDLDFTYEVSELARFRSNILKESSGVGAVFRIIPPEIPSMEDLGLPEVIKKIAAYKQGLIIVTGPTGSGKTTTMACLLDYINSTRSTNILTIEEPLEFIHKNKKSRINYREVGIHTPTFADAVRAARREDMDVIMIGELTDLDTLSEAIQAADIGNLVLGVMHTTGVTRCIERIIDTFPAQMQGQIRSMLAGSLRAIIAQQLIPTMDGFGRCAVIEVALTSQSLATMIRDGKTKMLNSVIHSSREIGMQSLDLALLQLVKDGKIDEETARLRSSSPSSFTVPEEFKPQKHQEFESDD